jgi:membrane protein implicated in regulation of membrane protease activity
MPKDVITPETQGFFEQLFEAFEPEVLMSWEFWVVASAVLLVAEFLTAGFLLGAFVPGTVLAAILAALGVGMQGQLWGFIVGTMIGLVVLRPIIVRKAQAQGVPSNVDALVGEPAIVTEAISASSCGRVKVRSEEWRASAGADLDPGAAVTVVQVYGNTVHVQAQS